MKNVPSNTDDLIDSRDIIERIEELRYAIETAESDEQTAGTVDDEKAELEALESLQNDTEGYADDWAHGATLIRDSYFTEYAEELCKDIGDLPDKIPGYIVIDWEETAENIRQDYTSVEFDGVTYWVR